MSDIDADEVVDRLRGMFDGRRIRAVESRVALIEQPPTDTGFARHAPGDITITIRLAAQESQPVNGLKDPRAIDDALDELRAFAARSADVPTLGMLSSRTVRVVVDALCACRDEAAS